MRQILYASAVGSLMYVTLCTRLDICYLVGMVNWYQSNPGPKHWEDIKHILKYLKRMGDYMLFYHCEDLISIGYTNSDFQSDLDFRKSTSSCVFTLEGRAISWRSVKQSCIVDFTMEAEYVATCEAVKEAVWLKKSFLILVLWEWNKFQSHCFVTIVEQLHNPRIQGITRMEST